MSVITLLTSLFDWRKSKTPPTTVGTASVNAEGCPSHPDRKLGEKCTCECGFPPSRKDPERGQRAFRDVYEYAES
jgi:hypothetical protein